MNSNHPSLSMYIDLPWQSQNTPDPLDEFLSQLLFDVPDVLPIPTAIYTSTPTFASIPEQAPAPIPFQAPIPRLTCHWVSRSDPSRICGAPLSPDPKHACKHFRLAHSIRGNEKATVGCLWHTCRAMPMQRGSLIRHLLAVHLGLLRWQCGVCGRVYSRKGTGHLCVGA